MTRAPSRPYQDERINVKRHSLTIDLRTKVIKKCGLKCFYCGKPGYFAFHFGKPTVMEFDKKKKFLSIDDDRHVLIDIPMHFEHGRPLIKGGKDTAKNIVIACSKCNWKKGTKLIPKQKAKI